MLARYRLPSRVVEVHLPRPHGPPPTIGRTTDLWENVRYSALSGSHCVEGAADDDGSGDGGG
jgi:hypothetical protein